MKPFGPNSEYVLSSSLEARDVENLEQLFYFNPNQWKLRKALEAAVEQYGTPQILNSSGKWRVMLPKIEGAQSLYLYRKKQEAELIGVMLYIRKEAFLKVLFWGLKPGFTSQAIPGHSLLLQMIEALRDVGRSVSGIHFISFNLGSREHQLRVGPATPPS